MNEVAGSVAGREGSAPGLERGSLAPGGASRGPATDVALLDTREPNLLARVLPREILFTRNLLQHEVRQFPFR